MILRDKVIAEGFDAEMVDEILGADGELPVAIQQGGNAPSPQVTPSS